MDVIRRLMELSVDELIDKQAELHEAKNEGIENVLRELTAVEEALYQKIKRDRNSEYADSLDMIKDSLIFNLINYGSYLKTEYRKDDHTAKETLKKALKFDCENPVAHYRLGFLAYKNRDYSNATIHFQNALKNKDASGDFSLTAQQIYNATLYLTNSGLHIAKQAQESLEEIEGEFKENAVNLELSPLYEMIAHTDRYFRNNAFTVRTETEEKRCSIDECEEIIDSRDHEQVILYFSDYEVFVYYQTEFTTLKIPQAELFRELMLRSNEEYPLTRRDLFGYVGEILANSFTKRIERLRKDLAKCNIPDTIIITRPKKGDRIETAYSYNHSFSYKLIQRTDLIQ